MKAELINWQKIFNKKIFTEKIVVIQLNLLTWWSSSLPGSHHIMQGGGWYIGMAATLYAASSTACEKTSNGKIVLEKYVPGNNVLCKNVHVTREKRPFT